MDDKRVVVVGATGMVGGCALRICLGEPGVSKVTAFGRRSSGVEHPMLTEILHDDFTDFAAVEDALVGHDVALYCVGAYTGAVPDGELHRITVDLTVAFAGALRRRSPQSAFCFLSGQGADQSERSRMAFARSKGAAEKAVLGAGFSRVHIFRPGYIYPVVPRTEPNLVYRITRVLYPLIRRVSPNFGLTSEDLARAMVHAGVHGTGDISGPVLENRDIRKLAAAGPRAGPR